MRYTENLTDPVDHQRGEGAVEPDVTHPLIDEDHWRSAETIVSATFEN